MLGIERPKGANISSKAASLKIRDEDGELRAIVVLRIDESDGVHIDVDTTNEPGGLVRFTVERTH